MDYRLIDAAREYGRRAAHASPFNAFLAGAKWQEAKARREKQKANDEPKPKHILSIGDAALREGQENA